MRGRRFLDQYEEPAHTSSTKRAQLKAKYQSQYQRRQSKKLLALSTTSHQQRHSLRRCDISIEQSHHRLSDRHIHA